MNAHHAILALLSDYFDGLYRGDTALLRAVFHPEAASFSAMGGSRAHQRVANWLELVAQRPSPQERGEAFRMRVLSLSVLHDIALAQVHVPAHGFDYYNVLSLVRVEGRWMIANKVFTDLHGRADAVVAPAAASGHEVEQRQGLVP